MRKKNSPIRKLAVGGSVAELGGKGCRLSELYRAGFPVPEGFVITTQAFDNFLIVNNLYLGQPISQQRKLSLPSSLVAPIKNTYRQVFGSGLVVVRSSATIEDLPASSFAGVYESVLDVGENSLGDALLAVYSSFFSDRALNYLQNKKISPHAIKMAVVVQRQVEPRFAGVCFTTNSVTGKKEYVVEWVMGRSQEFLSGRVVPNRLIFDQQFRLRETAGAESKEAPTQEFLSAAGEVLVTAQKIEDFFGPPQDIEWAIDRQGNLFILQSRDITTLKTITPKKKVFKSQIIAQGTSMSGGVACGPARKIVSDLSGDEANLLVQKGDIVLAYILRLDHLPALTKAAGVVTAEVSLLSHAAICARELKIPCVGGVVNALSLVADGELVAINGDRGTVSFGSAPKPRVNVAVTRLIYFNPERVKVLDTDQGPILYEEVEDKIIAYIDRVDNHQARGRTIQKLSRTLRTDPSRIVIDEHKAWEGQNSPSVVYDQYQTLRRLRRRKDTRQLLEEGLQIAQSLDVNPLRQFIERVDGKANQIFGESLRVWQEFKRVRDRSLAEEAAALLDQAKTLSGSLVGVATIDVYGTYFLEMASRSLFKRYGVTLPEIFSAAVHEELSGELQSKVKTKSDHELLIKLVRHAQVLSEYKNKRLDVLTHQGYTALDMINDFYSKGLDDIVAEYGW